MSGPPWPPGMGGAGFFSGISATMASVVNIREAIDATFRVHQFLTTRKERMAVGADFHADVALVRGACFERVPAGAHNIHFFVGGMDSGFHDCSPVV